MRSAAHRIADLEAKMGHTGIGRVYAVVGGPEHGNPADFVRSHGLPLDDAHDLIIHRVLMVPSPVGPTYLECPWGWVGTPPEGAL